MHENAEVFHCAASTSHSWWISVRYFSVRAWDTFQFEFVFRLVRLPGRGSRYNISLRVLCSLSTCLSFSVLVVRVCPPDLIYLFRKSNCQLKSTDVKRILQIQKCVERSSEERKVGAAQKKKRSKAKCACVCVCECVFCRFLSLGDTLVSLSLRYPTTRSDWRSSNKIIGRLGSFNNLGDLNKIFICVSLRNFFVWRSTNQRSCSPSSPQLVYVFALLSPQIALPCRFAAFGFHNSIVGFFFGSYAFRCASFCRFRLRIFIYILIRYHSVSPDVNFNCPLYGKLKIR